jgi:hypothetical protein
MAAAPPFVAYSTMTEVVADAVQWPGLYASLQALKAHVQEYPGCQSFDVFIQAEANGEVRVHCYTTWDTLAQAEVFVERGYTFERLLDDLGGGLVADRSALMEKVF